MATNLPLSLLGEAINQSNWLRDRVTSERIGGQLPILLWSLTARINFSNILEFVQKGYAFVYQKMTPKRNF